MTAEEILTYLEPMGSESYRRIIRRHGVREPLWGVKIEELQKIRKVVKKDHALALELFATGIYDAQYLAGLIADEKQMTPDLLRQWLATANCGAICASAVAWVAAESAHGRELALEWIESGEEDTAKTGWNVLSSWVALRDDSVLDIPELAGLLKRVETTIHDSPNMVRYAMNGFVIALGCYVAALTEAAIDAAERIGTVSVDMGETGCLVPSAPVYIRKVQARGTIGKKRKMARC